jgi:hypothetical protein
MTTTNDALPKPRLLKVGYHYYDYHRDGQWTGSQAVPFLRLSGHWLKQAGFSVGQRAQVHVIDQCIVIIPEP